MASEECPDRAQVWRTLSVGLELDARRNVTRSVLIYPLEQRLSEAKALARRSAAKRPIHRSARF